LGPETTFFSYARSDSDFALKLARDLRKAGADVWLDQLDIKSGSRWDLTIEIALKESSKMLVILSPDSVSSNNVMDEVSFALEEGKTVIPVLFRSCDIPFRLRRLQHADFTKNYDEALNNLLLALNLGKSIPSPHEKDDSGPIILKDKESEKDGNKWKAKEKKLNAQPEFTRQEKEENLIAQAETAGNDEERKLNEKAVLINIKSESRNVPAAFTLKKKKIKTPLIIAGTIVILVFIIMIVISGSNENRNVRTTEQLPGDPDGSHSVEAQYKIESFDTASKPVAGYEDPNTRKEVKQEQSRVQTQKPAEVNIQKPPEVEIQNPVEPAEKKLDLTGRWLTDENLEWKIIQKGDRVEITRYDRNGNTMIVEGNITGNTLNYRKSKTGNDIEGKFIISEDANRLDGMEKKFAGMRNNLKINRIQ